VPYHPAVARPMALLLLAVAWVLTWRAALDPDLWWHLELGREILATGRIPATEPWSWWTAGQPFLAHSWAWDVLVAFAFDVGGLLAVSLLGMLVSGVAVVLLWSWLGVACPDLPLVVRAGLVVAAVLTAVVAWSPRAQAIDLVAVLAVAVAWRWYLRDRRPPILAALPIVAVLWANLHGSAAPTGVVATLLACWIATVAGERLGAWRAVPRWPLVVASGVTLLGLAINPAGLALIAYPVDTAVASAFHPAIAEWRPPHLLALGYLPFTAALASIAAALVIPSTRRRMLREPLMLALAVGWTLAALVAARFVLLAGPLLVVAAGPAVLSILRRRVRSSSPDDVPRPARPTPALAWAIAALAWLVVMGAGWTLIAPGTQARLVDGRFPVAAADRLVAAGCEGRLLNGYDWGGYLIHRGITVGAYGNSPGSVVDVQAALEAGTADPGPVLADLDIDLALVPGAGPLADWFRGADGWRTAIDDGQALLAVRRDPGGCQRL
jgi:hypothetical protein